jgi:archaellum component FlaC
MDTNIENALNRLTKHAESLKDIKDLLELYNELKDLELRVKILKDMVAKALMNNRN